MRTRNYKADLEELEGEYDEARDYEFNEQFRDAILVQGVNTNLAKLVVTEDDIQGFLDSFDFPDVDEWCASEYESRLGEYADQKYNEWKERDI